jgi:hypothetical protein
VKPKIYTVCLALSLALGACSNEPTYEEELQQIAIEVNAKCPQMIDSETRLDGIEIKGDNTIEYKYTLVNMVVSGPEAEQLGRALWPGIVSNTKVSADMKKLRDHNTTLIYSYNNKLNKPACSLTITPKDYK